MTRFEKNVTLDIDIDSPEDGALSGAFKQLQVTQSKLDDLNDSFDDFSLGSVKEQIAGASDAAEAMNENLEGLSEAKDRAKEANQDLSEANAETQVSANEEAKSFRELKDAASSTAEMKNAVTKANKDLSDQNEISTDTLAREMEAVSGVDRSFQELIPTAERAKEKFSDTNDETIDLSNSLSKLRRRTNKSTQSMRAAAEIGEIFEDGLGSLSVNLGAFTVALRNFLTQVPLLLTALGSLGTAAGGAASGLGGLAGAAGLLAGAGLVAQGKALNEEFSQLESTGEGVQVVFGQMKETIAAAAAPIIENKESLVIFRDTVDALSFVVNAFANEAASTIPTVKEFGDALATDVAPAFRELIGAFGFAADTLQDDFIFALEAGFSAGANFIEMAALLADRIGEVPESITGQESRDNFKTLTDLAGQFTDTMADLAVVGTRVGSGLIGPIMTFLSTMEAVAKELRQLETETIRSIVQFGILVGVLSRVSGRAATLLKVLPNIALGMNNVATAGASANGVIGTFKAVMAAANAQLGGFLSQSTLLGGLTQLQSTLFENNRRLREVALNSTAADKAFAALSEESNVTTEELRELAISGELAEESVEDLKQTAADADLSNELSDVDIDAIDTDEDVGIGAEQFVKDGAIADSIFGSISDASRDVSLPRLGDGMSKSINKLDAKVNGMGEATKKARAKLLGLQAVEKALIPVNYALAAAEAVASSGALTLAASLTVATGGVLALAAVIGGLAVGVIANFDQIKSAASSTFGKLRSIIDIIVETSLVLFIESWNVIKNLFEAVVAGLSPLFDSLMNVGKALGLVGGNAKDGGGLMSTFRDVADTTKNVVRSLATILIGVFDILGGVLSVVSTLAAFLINIFVGYIQLAVTAWTTFLDALVRFLGLGDSAGSVFSDLVKGIFKFGKGITEFMKDIPAIVEDSVNSVIDTVNQFLKAINTTVPGVDIGTLDQVTFTGVEDTTQAEFASGADSAGSFIDGIMAPDANVTENNVDNSTTVNNQIDADPEKKQQLERTVKQAIRQANSFERRRQGSQ